MGAVFHGLPGILLLTPLRLTRNTRKVQELLTLQPATSQTLDWHCKRCMQRDAGDPRRDNNFIAFRPDAAGPGIKENTCLSYEMRRPHLTWQQCASDIEACTPTTKSADELMYWTTLMQQVFT